MKRKTHLPTSQPPSLPQKPLLPAPVCAAQLGRWICTNGHSVWLRGQLTVATVVLAGCNYFYISHVNMAIYVPPHPRLSLSCSCVLRAVKSQNHVAHSSFKVNNFWLIASTGQASRQLQAPLHSMLHFSNCWNGQQKIHSRARTTKKSPQTASRRTGWGQSPSGIRYTCIQIVVAAAPTWRQTERERTPTWFADRTEQQQAAQLEICNMIADRHSQASGNQTTDNQQPTSDYRQQQFHGWQKGAGLQGAGEGGQRIWLLHIWLFQMRLACHCCCCCCWSCCWCWLPYAKAICAVNRC